MYVCMIAIRVLCWGNVLFRGCLVLSRRVLHRVTSIAFRPVVSHQIVRRHGTPRRKSQTR